MQDTQLENALVQAAQRGVSIQVVLPAPGSGQDSSNAAGVALLRKAGISVRYDKQYCIHAKMLIEQARAYVGSENISTASLDDHRGLGLIVADPRRSRRLQQSSAAIMLFPRNTLPNQAKGRGRSAGTLAGSGGELVPPAGCRQGRGLALVVMYD